MSNHQNEAQELLDSRVSVYGERVKNMENVAKVFSGILGIEVRPDQVTLLMMGYKLVRASGTPDYEDNIKDVEGYALMFREIIGEDMIAAVNTDEYIAEKNRREPKVRTMADVEELLSFGSIEHPSLTIEDVQRTFGPYEETSEDFEERRQEELALSNSMGREDNVKPPLGARTQALAERIRLRFDKERAFLMGHARAAEIAAMEAMAQRGDE